MSKRCECDSTSLQLAFRRCSRGGEVRYKGCLQRGFDRRPARPRWHQPARAPYSTTSARSELRDAAGSSSPRALRSRSLRHRASPEIGILSLPSPSTSSSCESGERELQ
eukprot:3392191-Rhodomonas_salina.3